MTCISRVVTFSDSHEKPTRSIGASEAVVAPLGVEIGARLIGEHHRLDVERVDQLRSHVIVQCGLSHPRSLPQHRGPAKR